MGVSFQTLFRRSRFCAVGEEDEAKQRQNERFASAMIGFALEHDPVFRKHFLIKLCELPPGVKEDDRWKIWVEPKNWGDLVLCHPKLILIVELKIKAELDHHQNPEQHEFSSETNGDSCSGYGYEIVQFARSRGVQDAIYVTIEESSSWKSCYRQIKGLECKSKVWNDLVRDDPSKETDLERDVYDTLAALGVGIFIARKMKNEKLASCGTKPFAVLKGVLAQLDLKYDKRRLLDDNIDNSFGFNLRPEDMPQFNDAFCNLPEPDALIGWFGYEAEPPRMSVWLYHCSARKHRQVIQGIVGKSAKVNEQDENSMYIVPDHYTGGDLGWFEKVLLNLRNARQERRR